MRTHVSDFQIQVARELLLDRRVVLLNVVTRSIVLDIRLVRQARSTTVHHTLHCRCGERSSRRLARSEVLLKWAYLRQLQIELVEQGQHIVDTITSAEDCVAAGECRAI